VTMQKIYRDTALAALFFVVMGVAGYFVAPYIQGEQFSEVSRYVGIGLIVLIIARVLNVSAVERLIPTKVYIFVCGSLPFFGCATAALAPIGSVERDMMWVGMAGILLLTAMYPVSVLISLKKVSPKSRASGTDDSAKRPEENRDNAEPTEAEVLARAKALLGDVEEPQVTLSVLTRGIITEGFCPHDNEPLEVETRGHIAIARCPKCGEIFSNVVSTEEGIERKSQLFTLREIPY